jgi:hypothetical protein
MERRHHLLIAGTGRAGTSFLVRFLHELRFDTHISRRADKAFWDENAKAGYEDHVLWKSDELPYVVKFPWLFQAIDSVLAEPSVHIDGVIIPVRNLRDAAASRIVLELRNRYAHAPQLLEEPGVWDHWAAAPGGVIYSLDPLDVERALARGLHHLIERLATAEVPIHMLAFPRMIDDPGHLLRGLRGVLPARCTDDQILAAHARVADPGKVRVGRETADQGAPELDDSELEDLDRLALRREVQRLRDELATSREKLAAVQTGRT